MRKLFYALFLVAGMSFASDNVANAKDTKTKACCNKETVATTATKEKSKDCPVKNCPMASKKADCPMKTASATETKKCCTKAAPVAEAKKK